MKRSKCRDLYVRFEPYAVENRGSRRNVVSWERNWDSSIKWMRILMYGEKSK